MNKLAVITLAFICGLSLFLNIYKGGSIPPNFNSDEMAQGYNAYSILKTGKDEHGILFPLRLTSFGDYKLPLHSYLSIPFVWLLGLNETSTRMLNTVLSVLMPLIIFFLARELFDDIKVSLLSSFFVAVSVCLHIVGRQAHEGYLAALLISLSLLFYCRLIRKHSVKNAAFFLLSLLLSLFAYQSSRLFAVFFFFLSIIYFFIKKINIRFKLSFLAAFIFVLAVFFATDIIYKPERVTSLLFFNNNGFNLKISELKNEHGPALLYNPVNIGIKNIVFEYLKYFSPQFLVTNGDANYRFGFPDLSPTGPVEFVFMFIGIYYLFKNREKYRYLLAGIIIISPLSASLTWTDTSITRALFLFIPLLIIAAYGVANLVKNLPFNNGTKLLVTGAIIITFSFFTFYNWDFYFFHYAKRDIVLKYWDCGNKEMADYVWENYNKFDKFYITRKNNQPYIFLLFYGKYPPTKYQNAKKDLSPVDEYGFQQVNGFDKFDFNFRIPDNERKVAVIGYPDDFPSDKFNASNVNKIIKCGNQQVFWIYEIP